MSIRYIRFNLFPLLTVLFFSCHFGSGLSNYSESDKVPGIIHTDQLDQYYLLESGRKILKFDAFGKLMIEYSNETLSDITSIDASDPYKIMLFYREDQRIVLLDNFLSELSIVILPDFGEGYFSLVQRSRDGKIWLYDRDENTLKKIDLDGRLEYGSEPVNLEISNGFSPEFMLRNKEVGKHEIILVDPGKGLMIYDQMANFQRFIHLPITMPLYQKANHFIYLNNMEILQYNTALFESRSISSGIDIPRYLVISHDGREIGFASYTNQQVKFHEKVKIDD